MFMVNRQVFNNSNSSITIINGEVIIDGKKIDLAGAPVIQIEGEVKELKVDYCKTIEVKGNVGSITTRAGDVGCGHVDGSVQTASGDVNCGNIAGSVSSMSGDVSASGGI